MSHPLNDNAATTHVVFISKLVKEAELLVLSGTVLFHDFGIYCLTFEYPKNRLHDVNFLAVESHIKRHHIDVHESWNTVITLITERQWVDLVVASKASRFI